MEGVLISSDMLETTASQVAAQRGEMEALFANISQQIRSMNAFWQSPASNAALEKFEAFAPVFSQYTGLVDTYCVFLRQTAQAYRENEAALGGMA